MKSPPGVGGGSGFNLHSGGPVRDRIGSGGCLSGNCGGGGAIYEGASFGAGGGFDAGSGFGTGGLGAGGFDFGAGASGCAGGCAAADNHWAEQAAAATAQLIDGRVQR